MLHNHDMRPRRWPLRICNENWKMMERYLHNCQHFTPRVKCPKRNSEIQVLKIKMNFLSLYNFQPNFFENHMRFSIPPFWQRVGSYSLSNFINSWSPRIMQMSSYQVAIIGRKSTRDMGRNQIRGNYRQRKITHCHAEIWLLCPFSFRSQVWRSW